jgi:hypothetical protein
LLIISEASSSTLVEGLASYVIERQNTIFEIHNENWVLTNKELESWHPKARKPYNSLLSPLEFCNL